VACVDGDRSRKRSSSTGNGSTTLLAIVGPGLIVMVGDNDAGAFAIYGQAGQDYGTALLWTLLLLVPVLYVNQEMVGRCCVS
jgi:Mn2+/Fe2+ NRAMP family transporter